LSLKRSDLDDGMLEFGVKFVESILEYSVILFHPVSLMQKPSKFGVCIPSLTAATGCHRRDRKQGGMDAAGPGTTRRSMYGLSTNWIPLGTRGHLPGRQMVNLC